MILNQISTSKNTLENEEEISKHHNCQQFKSDNQISSLKVTTDIEN